MYSDITQNIQSARFKIAHFLFNLFSFTDSIPGLYKYDPHSYCCQYDFYKISKNFTYDPLYSDTTYSICSKNRVGISYIAQECNDDMHSYICDNSRCFVNKISTFVRDICNNYSQNLIKFKKEFKNEQSNFFLSKLNNLVCILVDKWVFPVMISPVNLEDRANPAYNILWNFHLGLASVKSGKYVIHTENSLNFDYIIDKSEKFEIIEIPKTEFTCSYQHLQDYEVKNFDETTEPYCPKTYSNGIFGIVLSGFNYLNHSLIVVASVCAVMSNIRLLNGRKKFEASDNVKILAFGFLSVLILFSILSLKI